ncbi:hypothetical protein TEA_030001 [Camellia sinensis var. sinensis]|uniref:Enoyl reductase (ER) domain-containing protein n=1 Tax=Camellia sinensis var. sinensis TaxID=542762 RepID=A0A4S4ESH7_CAMSN|nr:hypothetical protein TEA_030001 [Camellia sinensis var. sinensis]
MANGRKGDGFGAGDGEWYGMVERGEENLSKESRRKGKERILIRKGDGFGAEVGYGGKEGKLQRNGGGNGQMKRKEKKMLSSTEHPRVITCKAAAVAWGAGEALVMEEVEVSPPHPMEIRIKVVCTSLCRSDVTAWQSQEQLLKLHLNGLGLISSSSILLVEILFYVTKEDGGFEMDLCYLVTKIVEVNGCENSWWKIIALKRIVESVGQGVSEFEQGDHVLTLFTGECMSCRHCTSGKSNICQVLGLERRGVMHSDQGTRFSVKGRPIYHYCAVSSFSEYTVVHSGCAVKVSSVAPLEKICLLSCGVAAGLGAAWKVADIAGGSTVVIFGLGTVGLAVAQGAKLRGASRIVGVDTNPEKSEKAKVFGITDFINPHDYDEPIQQVFHSLVAGNSYLGDIYYLEMQFCPPKKIWYMIELWIITWLRLEIRSEICTRYNTLEDSYEDVLEVEHYLSRKASRYELVSSKMPSRVTHSTVVAPSHNPITDASLEPAVLLEKDNVAKVVKRITDGGADYSFECIGDTRMITAALQSSCDGWGLAVTLGVPKVEPEVSAHYALFLTGRTLKGSLLGGWKPKSDLPLLVDMYLREEIQIDEFITHNLSFEEINKAFDLMKEGKCLRCVLHMPK